MDYNKIKQLIENNRKHINFAPFGKGVSLEWIEKAQKRLNNQFPPSYVWWLRNYSGGEISGEEIFSVYELDFDTVVGGDIVYMNELSRKDGITSENQLLICDDQFGGSYYFDLKQKNINDEYPVYYDQTGEKFADNFLDFLEKKIVELSKN